MSQPNAQVEKTLAKQAASYAACCANEPAARQALTVELDRFASVKTALDTNHKASLAATLADTAFYAAVKKSEFVLNANAESGFRMYLAKLQIGGKPEEQHRAAQDATGKAVTIKSDMFNPLDTITALHRKLAMLLVIGKAQIGRLAAPGKRRQFGYNDAFEPLGNVSYREAAKAGVIAVCVPRNVIVPSLVTQITLPGNSGRVQYKPYAPNTDATLIYLHDKHVDALYQHHFADAKLAYGYEDTPANDEIAGVVGAKRTPNSGTGEQSAGSVLERAIEAASKGSDNDVAVRQLGTAAMIARGDGTAMHMRNALYGARSALHAILHAKDRTALLRTAMIGAELVALRNAINEHIVSNPGDTYDWFTTDGDRPVRLPDAEPLPVNLDISAAELLSSDGTSKPPVASDSEPSEAADAEGAK